MRTAEAIQKDIDYYANARAKAVKGQNFDFVIKSLEDEMVVLPCRVEDLVWVSRAYGTPLDPPEEARVNWFKQHYDGTLEAGLWMDLGEGKKEYGYTFGSFGKIVHLTRAEAEAAKGEKQ